MHRESISTPHVRHKGRQPLIKLCKHDFNFYIPFLHLYFFLCFLYFCLFAFEEGVSLAPTYSSIMIRKSDLRSSLRTKCLVKLLLSLFLQKCVFIE